MHVHPMEVQFCLEFTAAEKTRLAPAFMFGDAEEQLSYAIDQLGSERVATLIVEAKNTDIALLALTEVDGFSPADRERLQQVLITNQPA